MLFMKVHVFCQDSYLTKTKRNVKIRCEEHQDANKDYESAKHLKSNLNDKFSWKILMIYPVNDCIRKNLHESLIAP